MSMHTCNSIALHASASNFPRAPIVAESQLHSKVGIHPIASGAIVTKIISVTMTPAGILIAMPVASTHMCLEDRAFFMFASSAFVSVIAQTLAIPLVGGQ
jgi:hypothetical protein